MERNIYLNKLIRRKHNKMIKVITGIRRCGKSYLLFELFKNHLLQEGVEKNHIIAIALDDRMNKKYRNPDELCSYVHEQITDEKMYYVLLDEVQMVDEFEDVLNSFLHIENVDTYVTGSNAKFLSKDIITEFRGRGDQVHLYPLSFSEFMQVYPNDIHQGWQDYAMYGGMPKLIGMEEPADKIAYLKGIFSETYMKDILERNDVRNQGELEELLDYLASAIGGLTNPKKLADTFKSVKNISVHQETIKTYLDYFEDSFLIQKADRYDVKGKKYISTPAKYYFTDVGLRNTRLNFRQFEEPHIMENIIYNELIIRGYNVDVGVVEYNYYEDNKRKQKKLEVDFVCNQGSKRIYIQSALSLPTTEKEEQEQQSLGKINDSFKKIIIVKDGPTHYNENGIFILNLFEFLMDQDSINK
ncbi:MAG: ATP-binding protein [Saccharofermentans sp.]|jgi:predicted AAA+ superfamily ATPase|nr:ATP-binding protein [Mageeibacillus sp.]MCI1263577.1 ATP-binding protein [Saccharofermentans sp.]MCI1274485.1 ATP-binding protein [Saccharofermentans sp.]